MLKMIIQDLRISPGRTFLTGFSMLIGTIAVISVLAGSIGKEYLASTIEQLYGRAPTYSMSISSPHFSNSSALSNLAASLGRNTTCTPHWFSLQTKSIPMSLTVI